MKKGQQKMCLRAFGAVAIAAVMVFVGLSSYAASATGAATSAEAGAGQATSARTSRRAQMTPEKRAEMRAQREKFMAERKAAMEAKALEVVKKYVSDEEKAKALLAELEAVLMPSRRVRAARKPAEKKD